MPLILQILIKRIPLSSLSHLRTNNFYQPHLHQTSPTSSQTQDRDSNSLFTTFPTSTPTATTSNGSCNIISIKNESQRIHKSKSNNRNTHSKVNSSHEKRRVFEELRADLLDGLGNLWADSVAREEGGRDRRLGGESSGERWKQRTMARRG